MADKTGTTTRRTVVAAAGAAGLTAALAACGSDSGSGGGSDGGQDTPAANASERPRDGGGTGGGSGGLGRASEVPEGGGKIFKEQKVVVTQPKAGEFKAFSAICTHAGCPVSSVEGGTINCPCHGSKFSIQDGSVAGGPAPRSLDEKTVTVENGTLKVT